MIVARLERGAGVASSLFFGVQARIPTARKLKQAKS